LFQRIRLELLDTDEGEEVVLWSHLPIFGKFLGDGVLFLWDVADISPEARRNLIQAFDIICSDYTTIFLEKNKKDFTRPPSKLRCGIAQGQVTSIAKGTDYVGLCINIASRLQKLADDAFSFGFTKKGLDEKEGSNWYRNFRLIRIPVRGVANPELVYVLKSEFSVLPRDRQRELRVKL
jgi:class 3 adenylate cyclase